MCLPVIDFIIVEFESNKSDYHSKSKMQNLLENNETKLINFLPVQMKNAEFFFRNQSLLKIICAMCYCQLSECR